MDTLFVGLRVVVSLGAVLAVIWYAHRRITKGAGLTRSDRPITIVGRQSLSQKSSVVIIEADGKRLLLGVTDSTITVLSETEARIAHIPNGSSDAPGEVFAQDAYTQDGSAHDPTQPELSARTFARHLAASSPSASIAASHSGASRIGTSPSIGAPASPQALPASHGLLRGSILSAETWKLSFAALRQGPRR
jgi:flagellar protein FliO/FliZ